ncbi:MAG: SGNH/GDSL hydrolase family protein, partial [Bacteroidota bacterium]|nr:SGNH/GDSL hydrolase family protein [Bacteroidota bacterium]
MIDNLLQIMMKTYNRKIKGKSISWMFVVVLFSAAAFSLAWITVRKPALFIIGDSTVRNGDGRGNNGLWGWGDCIAPLFDTAKIHIENHARGGRSSRTYITEGLWEQVVSQIKPGDYLIMQFGHNDGGS